MPSYDFYFSIEYFISLLLFLIELGLMPNLVHTHVRRERINRTHDKLEVLDFVHRDQYQLTSPTFLIELGLMEKNNSYLIG